MNRLMKLAVALAFGLGAPVAALAQATPPQALVSAAKAEGKLVWYTQPGYRDALAGPIAEFRSLYPSIQIEMVEAGGPDLMERVRTERRAGRPVGDLITLGDSAAYQLAQEDGYRSFDADNLPNLANVRQSFANLVDEQKRFLPICVFAYGINVNTDMLQESEWPRSWKDLTDPKYKDKVALHDPSRPGGGLAFLLVGLDPLGEDYFNALIAQNPRIFARVSELDGAVVRGERPISIPGRNRVAKDFADAPIKWIIPEEGIFVVSYQAGVVKNAPHPAAAELMLNFLLGRSMQQAFADLGDVPIMEGLKNSQNIDAAKFLGNGAASADDFAKMADRMAFGKKLLANQ